VITGIIEENIENWSGWITVETFKTYIDAYYRENNTPVNYRPSMQKINNATKEWCQHFKIDFLQNCNRTLNSVTSRWHFFGRDNETPF